MSEDLSPDDFEFCFKPPGTPTHRPSEDRVGFVEWLNQSRKQPLLVCHRLDKETSGVMVFARNKTAAGYLSNEFSSRKVSKSYLFLSDKKSQEVAWTVTEKKARGATVRPEQRGGDVESCTEFERVSESESLFLYRAKPITGKTHQIRKHAVQSSVPILGDQEYGGKPFPRLMLHSHQISFNFKDETLKAEMPTSKLFSDPSLCADTQLASWIVGIERRMILFPDLWKTDQCLRLLHTETGDLRIDQAGERWVMGWWKSEPPTDAEQKKINRLVEIFDQQQWVFHWRPGVNQKDHLEILQMNPEDAEQNWSFKESELFYQASLERGQNFGLFLDQRDRRQWVKAHADDKRVLNLFAFSCGFSLNAAAGGAQKVVSVDIFPKYLNWGKENFLLNGIDPENEAYEFRKMDSLDYLRYAEKKGHQFDVIVCDPPSFSRLKKQKKVFRVERDFPELLTACSKVLAPGGVLLFSTNFERWPLEKWEKELRQKSPSLAFATVSVSPSQWDYEWNSSEANLKAFFLKKACPPKDLDV